VGSIADGWLNSGMKKCGDGENRENYFSQASRPEDLTAKDAKDAEKNSRRRKSAFPG
jgi:hypothetical protein